VSFILIIAFTSFSLLRDPMCTNLCEMCTTGSLWRTVQCV